MVSGGIDQGVHMFPIPRRSTSEVQSAAAQAEIAASAWKLRPELFQPAGGCIGNVHGRGERFPATIESRNWLKRSWIVLANAAQAPVLVAA